jgi:hypothetical protein
MALVVPRGMPRVPAVMPAGMAAVAVTRRFPGSRRHQTHRHDRQTRPDEPLHDYSLVGFR